MDRLPLELLQHIVSFCDKNDALDLRLVSKAFSDVAAQRAFSTFSLCCYAFSVERLSSLSRSAIARHLRRINVFPDFMYNLEDAEVFCRYLREPLGEYTAADPNAIMHYHVPKEHWPETFELYQILIKDQAKMSENPQYYAELQDIFNRLPLIEVIRFQHFSENESQLLDNTTLP